MTRSVCAGRKALGARGRDRLQKWIPLPIRVAHMSGRDTNPVVSSEVSPLRCYRSPDLSLLFARFPHKRSADHGATFVMVNVPEAQ